MAPVASVTTVIEVPDTTWPPSTASMPPPAAASPGGGPAVGQAAPNTTYMGLRLQYQQVPEPSFDPVGNTRFLIQVAMRYALYAMVYMLGACAGIIICGILAIASPVFGIGLFLVVGALIGLALAICFWFLKVPIQLSEWKISVDNKGAAMPAVFDHVAWVVRGRGIPLDSMQVRRLKLPGEGTRDYLELRHGLFAGYVACFAYGSDLYVGWTFWITLSPFQYVCMIVMRVWHSVTNKGNDLYTSLRYDSARAMRETMHSATREGVDVAIGQLAGQGHGIVGSSIAVAEAAG
ncbi:MAG TPA: hypothetical protein VH478_01480 [Trebonia sp.]|nr:hypothetical protein [Trebonia sp.]